VVAMVDFRVDRIFACDVRVWDFHTGLETTGTEPLLSSRAAHHTHLSSTSAHSASRRRTTALCFHKKAEA
jgi:hypothetical protein